MDIKDYKYDITEEGKKLEFFVNECRPQKVDIESIKRKTYDKIAKAKAQRRRRRLWISLSAAAACVAVLLSFGYIYIDTGEVTVKRVLAQVKKPVEYVTETVPVGERHTIILSDGTKIIANSRTKIVYPKTFDGDTREVKVEGQAYFEVTHDEDHPFIVNMNDFRVQVLGTKFDVNSYAGVRSEVVLVEGSVKISTGKQELKMKPNQLVSLTGSDIVSVKTVDASQYISWRNGFINLNGESMPRIIERLNNYYGTSVKYDGKQRGRRFYGKLVLQDNISKVMESLEEIK